MGLQEIRDRYKPGTVIRYNFEIELFNQSRSDIEYLINRIERYETVLKEIAFEYENEEDGYYLDDTTKAMAKQAEEALKEG